MTTSAATNSAATASAPWWPARTSRSPISTATDPARSDVKWTAFAASAAEPVRRDVRKLASAREASTTITTPSTASAHQVTSTWWPSAPPVRRSIDSYAMNSDTSIRNALSPSAARCSAFPWP